MFFDPLLERVLCWITSPQQVQAQRFVKIAVLIFRIMSLLVVLRSLCSLSFLSGSAITAMGLGVIPIDDKMWECATKVIGENTVPAQPFMIFLGVSKILGVLGLWNKGPFARKTLVIRGALGLPPLCAIFGHYLQGDTPGTIAASVYLCLFAVYQFLEGQESGKGKMS